MVVGAMNGCCEFAVGTAPSLLIPTIFRLPCLHKTLRGGDFTSEARVRRCALSSCACTEVTGGVLLLVQRVGLLLSLDLRVDARARRGLAVGCVGALRHRAVVVVVRVVLAVVGAFGSAHAERDVLRAAALLEFLSRLFFLLLRLRDAAGCF